MAMSAHIIDQYQGVAPKPIIRAVQNAAVKTGTNFSYLMEKASMESKFDPHAASKNSSARGLFQFIESTWLDLVKEFGGQFGLKHFADHIERKDGKLCVKDCIIKEKILALRKDPETSALMAGAYAAKNRTYLEKRVDGPVNNVDLYLAHFLGPAGAAKFLTARAENGEACAADCLPQAARANKNIFYDTKASRPRSLDEVYTLLSKKLEPASPVMIAVKDSPPAVSVQETTPPSIPTSSGLIDKLPLLILSQSYEETKPTHTFLPYNKDRFGYNS